MDGVVQDRCPRRPFMPGDQDHDGISEALWYYAAYKRGQLPEQGGLQDQPGMLMDIFRVIDGAVGTIEMDQQAEAKRAAARGSNGRGGARLTPKRT
jgi:hypothetical protein